MTCDPSGEVPLASALIIASRTTDGLRWDVRYFATGKGGAITFAVPLLAEERLVPTRGVTAITTLDGARITGVCIEPEAMGDHTIAAAFVQPRGGDALGAPVAAGSFVQVIDGPSTSDVRLQIDAIRGLEHHVGFVAPRTVDHWAREEARRWTGTAPHLTKNPVFVRGDDVLASGGLSGRLVDPRAEAPGSALAVLVLFIAAVGALTYAARSLRRTASAERADALLVEEIYAAAAGPKPSGRP